MQITYKGDYALKAILYLSINYNRNIISIQELSKKLDIPIKFLEQILLELKKGGFVESKRGIKGGYHLLKAPKDIKVGDVTRFIDGPIEPIACVNSKSTYKGCADMYSCVFRDIWVEVTRSISSVIDNISFQDLALRFKKGQGFNYSI